MSLRNIAVFVAAVVAASFTFSLLVSHTTHAADATWDGDSIVYGGNAYRKVLGENDTPRHGLPDGTVYMYTPEVTTGDPEVKNPKAYVIYFAPGSDPGKVTNAHYAVYDVTAPGTYAHQSGVKAISTEKKTEDKKGSECVIPKIGWLICSVSSLMAEAMDWMYDHLGEFLEVRPLASNQDNSLYGAWTVMRNIANVAFVMAFLIIIYSQVTSFGMSNYGIKRLMPRLVIAAVLVNISYWICAVAIDLSNIAGYGLNDLFKYLTEQMRNAGSNTAGLGINFTNVTQLVLSGGTLGAAGALAFLSTGSIIGAVYMLLPVLVGVLIAALVALIIMAARQALIVILVIISPLAFVAYLLPNTEKYFEKWKDVFLTMLMLFPIFGVLFGGSQLAGTVIIQNANSIIMLILGMAVQIAPLVLLPFLIKFGGSLLGRVAGMSNDRTKGLLDQTRQFAQNKAELRKSAVLARPKPKGARRPLTRAVQGWDNLDRKRKEQLKTNEMLADARWNGSNAAHKLHAAASRAEMMKNIAEHDAEAHVAGLKRTNAEMQGLDWQTRASKLHVDLTQAKVDANWEELKAGDARSMIMPENLSVSALADFAHGRNSLAQQIQTAARDEAVVGMRKHTAEQKRGSDLTNALIASGDPAKLAAAGDALRIDGQSLTEYGGGIRGVTGAETVLADAVNKERSEFRARVGEKQQLMKHFNVTNDKMQKLALGSEDITVTRDDGVSYVFKKNDDFTREAAIDNMLKGGSFGDIQKIIEESGEKIEYTKSDGTKGERQGLTYDFRTSIKDVIIEKGLQSKALYYGHQTLDDVAMGKINGSAGLDMAAARSLANGKISDANVSGMGAQAIERMFKVKIDDLQRSEQWVNGDAAERTRLEEKFADSQTELAYSAWRVMNDNLLMRNADKSARDILRDKAKQPPNTP